jgi:hypothetical protein
MSDGIVAQLEREVDRDLSHRIGRYNARKDCRELRPVFLAFPRDGVHEVCHVGTQVFKGIRVLVELVKEMVIGSMHFDEACRACNATTNADHVRASGSANSRRFPRLVLSGIQVNYVGHYSYHGVGPFVVGIATSVAMTLFTI